MNVFVSCHFNWCNYSVRNKLTKEFLEKYPNIVLLEVSYGLPYIFEKSIRYKMDKAGWASNICLNKYLADNMDSIESLTFIDADVELYSGFFERVIKRHKLFKDVPYYLQPYKFVNKREDVGYDTSLLFEILENDLYSSSFHTGYAYSYNKKLLKMIYPLPETLVLGGYDTVLYYSLLRLIDPFTKLLECIRNGEVVRELISFYRRFEGVKYGYLNGSIKTYEHGKMINRKYNSRMGLYEGINSSVIEDYFKFRNEDDYL